MNSFLKRQILVEPKEFTKRLEMGEVFRPKLSGYAVIMEDANGDEIFVDGIDWRIEPKAPGTICPRCHGTGKV